MQLGEIPTSRCESWRGTRNTHGYGVIKKNKRTHMAHRHVWELANGPIPKGLYVLHRCDNRACVRIDHLFLGTAKDNSRDMVLKDRPRGRPVLPKYKRKSELFRIYVTQKQAKAIRRAAREHERPPPEFIRDAALEKAGA